MEFYLIYISIYLYYYLNSVIYIYILDNGKKNKKGFASEIFQLHVFLLYIKEKTILLILVWNFFISKKY